MHVVRDGVPAKDKSNASRKALNMAVIPERSAERKQYEFFLALPNPDRTLIKPEVKSSQFADRSSSTPALARAAARRRTSSC